MIRNFEMADIERAEEIHAANNLPETCFPPLMLEVDGKKEPNALFVEKAVMEIDGEPVMSCFLKVTSEVYLLVDHTKGTPENRWAWLQEMKDYMLERAKIRGFDQITAWVPNELESSFGKRLLEFGFIRSPWQSYTLLIE